MQIYRNRANQPNFSTTIKFVPKYEFDVQKGILCPYSVRHPFDIKSAASCVKQAFTEDAYDCSIMSVLNEKSQLLNMCHIGPGKAQIEALDKTKNVLSRQVKKLFETAQSELSAFITGGIKIAELEEYFAIKHSPILQNSFIDVLKNLPPEIKTNITVIGLKNDCQSHVSVISDAKTNTHYVLAKDCDNNDILSVDGIIRNFQRFIISDKDTIKIRKKDITKELREKSSVF